MLESADPVEGVAIALAKLGAICDRGYALAVHIRLTRPTLLYQTYPTDWSDHYSIKGYMMSDPTVLWGFENTGSIRWGDLADKDTAGIFADARKFGLDHGCSVATGPASSRTIASGVRAGTDFTDAEIAQIAALVQTIHDLTDNLAPDALDHLRGLQP